MRHGIGTAAELRAHHRIQGNHRGSLRTDRPHINLGNIVRRRPILRFRFRLHPEHPAEFDKIVDVQIPEIGLQRVEHFGNRHA